MNASDREHARAAALKLLTAHRHAAGGQAPVTEGFRCWTPVHDWAAGADGLAALREVLRACAAAVPGADTSGFDAVISDGEHVVVEASAPARTGQLPVSATFVLAFRGGLVDEVRCYLDPKAVGW